ncbi:Biotin/lipoyl attachment [Penicillium cf. griseofulvum]|nr:Biotin/lipoyl attachment [Penicillium cf. griseofulvum]
MSFTRSGRLTARNIRPCLPQNHLRIRSTLPLLLSRKFHASSLLWGIKSQVLKDVGEGITEVQIIQWYVEEGAHIEEWKPLCQYQSDKAVDDITSRYEGVIKKLHFETDDTVPTGRALCDIEVADGKYPDDNPPHESRAAPSEPTPASEITSATQAAESSPITPPPTKIVDETPKSKHASLAVPAVRGLLKNHGVDILQVNGTGKDGRVMKEDMFKTMTKSLNIPHFLYADELKVNGITAIRKKLASDKRDPTKITFLPFVVKAVSQALTEFPILNSKVDTTDPAKPKLVMRAKHNIGIAMDTPNGLIVPNIKDVASRSIFDIAAEVSRLSALGQSGKLSPADLSGGTITVSNIGNIGGTYVSPVIVSSEVAILGVGKTRAVPVFDEDGQVTRGDMVNFSWSADHRVVDGATMARMGNRVKDLVESPELMLLNLR